jgi:hypothetical protein
LLRDPPSSEEPRVKARRRRVRRAMVTSAGLGGVNICDSMSDCLGRRVEEVERRRRSVGWSDDVRRRPSCEAIEEAGYTELLAGVGS